MRGVALVSNASPTAPGSGFEPCWGCAPSNAGDQSGSVICAASLPPSPLQLRAPNRGARHRDAELTQAGIAAPDQPAAAIDRADGQQPRGAAPA